MSIVHISKSIYYHKYDHYMFPAGWHYTIEELHDSQHGHFTTHSVCGPYETASLAQAARDAEIERRLRDDKLDNLPEWKRIELLELAATSGLFSEEPL